MWVIIAILFIICMCTYPYVASAIARRRMLTRLCADIRRAGGKIRRQRRFPALTRNGAKTPELLVRTERAEYTIKLWSPKYRDADFFVEADGCVWEARAVGAPLTPREPRRPRTVRGLRSTVPPTKLRVRTKQSLRQENILLVYPAYRRILQRDGGKWCEVSSGDMLLGKRLCTPADLLSLVSQDTACE